MIHKRTTLSAILFADLLALSQLFSESSRSKTLTGKRQRLHVRRSTSADVKDRAA